MLGLDKAGLYDNFFDLGGHSFLSMQVIARLEKATGLKINPRELMLQSLAQFALSCEERIIRQQRRRGGFISRLFDVFKSVVPSVTANREHITDEKI